MKMRSNLRRYGLNIPNVPRNNGKVGMWGISYPGFYAAAALPEAHPALVASSPQAPIADFFFDDFHHHGAYTLAYWFINPLFSVQHDGPTPEFWFQFHRAPPPFSSMSSVKRPST